MNKIFEKWWDKGNKCFSIINYKQSWKEVGNKPRFTISTNGAKKRRGDRCLDVNIIIGYININYVNFDLQGTQK